MTCIIQRMSFKIFKMCEEPVQREYSVARDEAPGAEKRRLKVYRW